MNVCVVGCGWAAEFLHLPAYSKRDDIYIASIVDIDSRKRVRLSKEFGVANSHSSLEKALESEHVDLISVTTPPRTHYEICLRGLENDCHVFVEKPFTVTAAEAEHLFSLAQKKNLRLCVNHSRKYRPAVERFVNIVRNGSLGELIHLERVWNFSANLSPQLRDPNRWEHDLPGGFWTEHAPHDLYIAYQILGPMRLVDVQVGMNARRPWVAGTSVWGSFRNDAGATYSLRYSVNENVTGYKRLTAFGTKNSISTNDYAIQGLDGFLGDCSLQPSDTDKEALRLLSLMERRRIFVFGTGAVAESLCSALDLRVVSFLDNDSTRQGGSFRGAPVVALRKADLNDNAIILIASSFDAEIAKQLQRHGFHEGEDFFVVRKLLSYLFRQGSETLIHQYVNWIQGEAESPVPWAEIKWVNSVNLEFSEAIVARLKMNGWHRTVGG